MAAVEGKLQCVQAKLFHDFPLCGIFRVFTLVNKSGAEDVLLTAVLADQKYLVLCLVCDDHRYTGVENREAVIPAFRAPGYFGSF